MDKIKIGVFGAGRGRVMIDTVAGYPDAELVAICDKYEYLLRYPCKLCSRTRALRYPLP